MARDGLRGHLSGSLPISVAVHLAVLLMLFAVPLIGNIIVPTVMATAPGYMLAAPAPPPPEVLVHPTPRPPQNTASDAPMPIPTTAPTAILPDRDVRSFDPGPAPPDSTAIGDAVGVPMHLGTYAAAPRPPDPPKPSGSVRVADLPVAPRKTADMRPIYPDIARLARIEGTVVMEAVLDPSGRVTQLHVIKSVPMLDQAALDAVGQWRYTPSVYGGRPVSVLMTITVRFTLQ
jgi:protein TonB